VRSDAARAVLRATIAYTHFGLDDPSMEPGISSAERSRFAVAEFQHADELGPVDLLATLILEAAKVWWKTLEMTKDAQQNIVPWILGGLLILGAGTAPATPPQPSPPTVATQPPTGAALPADQVWQCEVNGQKVFSDKRCGAGASIRQLNAVNGMDTPLPLHVPRYPSVYGPGPAHAPAPSYAPSQSYDPDSSQDAQNPNEVYGANQYVVIDERRRREHHPPHPQNHPAVRAHATR
jgi:hypothetical protein